jgi:peptidoglycan/LPS O-acetylase OafA/YrhL
VIFLAAISRTGDEGDGWLRVLGKQIGDASYSLYLIHPLVFMVLGKTIVHVGADALLLAGPVICVVTGTVVYRFVELRLTVTAQRLTRRLEG